MVAPARVAGARSRWRRALLDDRPVCAAFALDELRVRRGRMTRGKAMALVAFALDARVAGMDSAAEDALAQFPPRWRARADDMLHAAALLTLERAGADLQRVREALRSRPTDPAAHLAVAEVAYWSRQYAAAQDAAATGRAVAAQVGATAELVALLDRLRAAAALGVAIARSINGPPPAAGR